MLERVERGEIDPSFIVTHRVSLDDAPEMYRACRDKQDVCIKVVMKPGEQVSARKHKLQTAIGNVTPAPVQLSSPVDDQERLW